MRVIVNLVYDDEYKGYVADVPELPGCMSQGKTIEAALRNVRRPSPFTWRPRLAGRFPRQSPH